MAFGEWIFRGKAFNTYSGDVLGARNPEKFAGIAAHGPVTKAPHAFAPINLVDNLKNTPICIVHSTDDKIVSIKDTKEYVEKAKKNGVNIFLVEKRDKGKHTISKAYHSDSFMKLKEFHNNN